jgi:hypothetical protein
MSSLSYGLDRFAEDGKHAEREESKDESKFEERRPGGSKIMQRLVIYQEVWTMTTKS